MTFIKRLRYDIHIIGYDKESYKYDLYGICNHSGGSWVTFTAFVKNANDKWYHYNDTNCNEINEKVEDSNGVLFL